MKTFLFLIEKCFNFISKHTTIQKQAIKSSTKKKREKRTSIKKSYINTFQAGEQDSKRGKANWTNTNPQQTSK